MGEGSVPGTMSRVVAWMAAVTILCLGGCSKTEEPSGRPGSSGRASSSFLDLGTADTPQDRRYLEAGEPFMVALAAQDYAGAYALLSHCAIERMSLNQFVVTADAARFSANEANPLLNVTEEQFAGLMGQIAEQYGAPERPLDLGIFSTDPDVLAKRVKGMGVIESAFAVGAMPDSVPPDIRRASLRGKIGTKPTEAQIAEWADKLGVMPAELVEDPDWIPFFGVKIVLVEEGDALKAGYFEFLPPGLMD